MFTFVVILIIIMENYKYEIFLKKVKIKKEICLFFANIINRSNNEKGRNFYERTYFTATRTN